MPDRQRARALTDWELQVFDRRLVYGQGRVDYGGGLLFDLKTLHRYVETSEWPVGSEMIAIADELGARWQKFQNGSPGCEPVSIINPAECQVALRVVEDAGCAEAIDDV